MDQQFEIGQTVGRKHFARIREKGSRWMNRRVPAYIRQHLMVPYYFAPGSTDASLGLWVIQYPITDDEKVHFVRYANDVIANEESITQVHDRPK